MFAIIFNGITDSVEDLSIEVDCQTLSEAEDAALCQCRILKGHSFIELNHIGHLIYNVFEGVCVIGHVKIRSL